MDERLVQLSKSQHIRGYSCPSKKHRDIKIMVPVPSASRRDDRSAECARHEVKQRIFGEKIMRLTSLCAAAFLLAASLPSSAQIALDMNQITCGGWLGYSQENRDFVRFWLSGYYNAAANSNVLNYDAFQKNSAKVAGYCRTHKSQSLPTAIKNLGLWK